ncbi:tripartite tricarboxylate transporter substrate binding protein [Cocleimonas sp. KMM 6892]|uniref:tripartite tricarboxylate transporter substrate binding protein n=1 Tax=unclassified Cocleimonas TaxID=2639732 RepID=UPI002DBCF194|nr:MULTISPECIES: tripartite tricarboxylate transporter substrate binding protein [unclassified Cocleimonas]MEB8431045.1 tripartite tricarboxylate transporter substrate binding protein [Cocleimonas sp. KMM 6892]MEC4714183.1 tripartite tricarboxylate transporter substrate binding protein [Cocleimonas sp. KMM 6895]
MMVFINNNFTKSTAIALGSMLTMVLLLTSSSARAEYPEKPIELVVGYGAGGGTDVMARLVAPFIEKNLGDGASIIIKNVPGASGQIGITKVANAKPDGYTLGTYNLPGMMARTLDRKAGYSADSFSYLANVVGDPNVIVTQKSSPINSTEKLISAAKAAPGELTVSVSALGGDDQFALISLSEELGTEFNLIPFKGSAKARTAVMGGHVSMSIMNLSEAIKFSSELNILGVAMESRSPLAPNLPTFKEQGVNLIGGSQRGIIAPKGLPENVEKKLLAAFEKAFQDPAFTKSLENSGNPPGFLIGDKFKEFNNLQLERATKNWKVSPWKK